LAKRRQRSAPRRRTSSADIRFGLVLLAVAGILLLLGGVLLGQLRAADWTGATVSGGIAFVLLAASAYSVVQKRRG